MSGSVFEFADNSADKHASIENNGSLEDARPGGSSSAVDMWNDETLIPVDGHTWGDLVQARNAVLPRRSWRYEVLDPTTMTDSEIRAELRHDLRVYDEVSDHPLCKQAMRYRIECLVREADSRTVDVEEPTP